MCEWLKIRYTSYADVPAEWGSPENVKITYGVGMNNSTFLSLFVVLPIYFPSRYVCDKIFSLFEKDLEYGSFMRISPSISSIASVTIKRECGEDRKIYLKAGHFPREVSLRELWGGSRCQSLRERLDEQQREQEDRRRREEEEEERQRQAEMRKQLKNSKI